AWTRWPSTWQSGWTSGRRRPVRPHQRRPSPRPPGPRSRACWPASSTWTSRRSIACWPRTWATRDNRRPKMDPGISSLPPDERRALLAEVLRRRASQPLEAPLSPGQERLWRLLAVEPDSPVYNLGFAYFLKGLLDVGALERTLGALTRRHEALR